MRKFDPEYSHCPICQSDKIDLYHRDFRDNQIFRCAECTTQFMNPVYSNEYLTKYYAYEENVTGISNEDQLVSGQQRTNLIKFKAIEKYILQPGHLLDFGCGNGNLFQVALGRGWQVTGYDVDCTATGHVAKRYGVEIGCGDLHAIDWPAASFDLLHAHHVVEHLKTPVKDLGKLNYWLKPNGYFYVAVPNINAFSAKLKFYLEKLGLRRKNVGKYYDSDHHVFYYSPKSMRLLLEQCGFEVVMTMNGNKDHISKSAIGQFFTYTLTNYLYASSAFFMIARKVRQIC